MNLYINKTENLQNLNESLCKKNVQLTYANARIADRMLNLDKIYNFYWRDFGKLDVKYQNRAFLNWTSFSRGNKLLY